VIVAPPFYAFVDSCCIALGVLAGHRKCVHQDL
jgi:hypothetical protein